MLRFKGEDHSERRKRNHDRDADRDKPRNRSSDRRDDRGSYRENRYRSRSRSRDREDEREEGIRNKDYGRKVDEKYSSKRSRSRSPQRRDPFALEVKEESRDVQTSAPKEEKKKKVKKPKIAPTAEPMILVTVNDRLGTKASIPCLASDPIKAFKALVAAQIGREPHEIMLKRQGERPFKDNLTLEDYGVSNGVQLDLEVDTGE